MATTRASGAAGGVSASVITCGLASGLALLLALPALAAGPPQSLHDALFPPAARGPRTPSPGGMPPPPPVARYQLDVGEGFVIDRLGRDEALIKYDRDDEIWALKGVVAAHGDMVFKNDMGEPVLRASRWGGITLFTSARPDGAAASLEGGAVALHAVSPLGPQALGAVLAQASARAGRAAGHLVTFDVHIPSAPLDWLFADAADLTADAFARAAQAGHRVLVARFSSVKVEPGRAAGVVAAGPLVIITVAPERGLAGRPSSRRIEMVVERR